MRSATRPNLAGDVAEQSRVEAAAAHIPPVFELFFQPLQRAHVGLHRIKYRRTEGTIDTSDLRSYLGYSANIKIITAQARMISMD